MDTIAFIGCGNMGCGMLKALCANPVIDPASVLITERNESRLEKMMETFGCQGTTSNTDAVKQAKYVILCVKPQVLPSVMEEIRPVLQSCIRDGQEKILVSIAAGTPIDKIQELSGLPGEKLPIVRILPNLPAGIGEGLIFFTVNHENAQDACITMMSLFEKGGMLRQIPESQMDVAGVIGGCVPAFAYMFVEAMADGAVMSGMARTDAIAYAAQAVKGACSLVIEGSKHPEQLKDEVCSPAGTTIAGVKALEEHGFRNAAFSAVTAAYDKSVSLSSKK